MVCHFLLFPHPGINPATLALADRFFTTEPSGKLRLLVTLLQSQTGLKRLSSNSSYPKWHSRLMYVNCFGPFKKIHSLMNFNGSESHLTCTQDHGPQHSYMICTIFLFPQSASESAAPTEVLWRLSCKPSAAPWDLGHYCFMSKPVTALMVLWHDISVMSSFATPWTGARQAPLSKGFSRQEHWSGKAAALGQPRSGVGRKVGGGFRMEDTCAPMADSCQWKVKTITVL